MEWSVRSNPPDSHSTLLHIIWEVINVLDDFVLIQHKLPSSVPHMNIYPIGDVHIGSNEFNLEQFEVFLKIIENDPYGYAVIVGDLMNMGLKTSKSNVYDEILSPLQQKELCYDLLKPIAHKILAGCSGNHEARSVREVGSNPLYDVFCRLQIEDKYRENACFLKVAVGTTCGNPNVYSIVLTHGKSKKRDLDWTYAVDGADLFISGHTHLGTHQPCSKIRIDLTHNKVKLVDYQHIVVLPFQRYGGYALANKYVPNTTGKFQRIQLYSNVKRVSYNFE